MKDCESFRKAVDFYSSSDIYGTAIARIGWRTDERLENFRSMGFDAATGGRKLVSNTRKVTTFDGPDWDVVDILDFLPQPGKKRIQECDWVIHRYYMDLDQLDELAAQGIYDPAAVRKLRTSGNMPTQIENDYLQRVNIYRSYSEYDARRQERYAKPVEVVEMWGRVPSEFAPDGLVHRVVTVANGNVLLRNRPNPFWHGQIPFVAYSPMPDPHYFHGPGKIEVAEKMQYAANRYANQKMDGLDLAVDQVWLVNSSLGIDTQNLYMRPGRVIKVDGAIGEDQIRPLSPDLRGIGAANEEISFLWNAIQQATGIIEDTVQGGQGGRDRQTAHEFAGRQENVMTRLMLEARLAEEGFVEPMANMFVSLNKQFLTIPKEVRILGTDATVNPVTGFPLPQQAVTIDDISDINHDYRARAVGSTQMMGRAMMQQQLIGLMQVISANPVGMQMVNWTAYFRQMFDAFQLRNVDELLNPGPTQVNQAAQQQGPASVDDQINQAGSAAPIGPGANQWMPGNLFQGISGNQ